MKNCVILAGGRSSRMGKDKTLLPFGNEPTLTHFVAKRLEIIFENVFVSSKFQKFDPPLNLIKDESLDDFSPMLALYSILNKFDSHVFIIPADMPFVKLKTIQTLSSFVSDYDVVIARDGSYRHSLCGFFSPKLAPIAKKLYERGDHKIGIMLESVKLKEVLFEDNDEFFNINYPSDYERALNV